jgi:predicted transcriptional regulator
MPVVQDLGELQLAVLRVLWKRGEATAADVHAALRSKRIAITTVSTILSRLEKRGVVRYRTEGRSFVYRATVTEEQVRHSAVRSMVDSLFAGDSTALVSQLLDGRDVTSEDLERMRTLINAARRAKVD